MARQPTTQVIRGDEEYLIALEEEVHEYRGLRTKRENGSLTIYLIDSEKYWRKQERQNRKKKSKYDYDDDDYNSE